MLNYNISAIGYLFKLLNISTTEISQQLYIDRTLISKWKTGSRKLLSSSPYYKKLIECLIDANKESGSVILQSFFSSMYPQINKNTPKYLEKCLHLFMSTQDAPISAKNLLNNDAYTAQFSIYTGHSGKSKSLLLLLDTIEASSIVTELFIVDFDFYIHLNKDITFMKLWHKRLLRILDFGHKVTVVHSDFQSISTPTLFYSDNQKIFFHSNLQEYCYSFSKRDFSNTYFIVKNQISIVSYEIFTKKNPRYTAAFTDLLTISHHQSIVNSIVNMSTPIIKPSNKIQKSSILKVLQKTSPSVNTTYFTNLIPTFATMSENLLNDILNKNNLTMHEKALCRKMFLAFKNHTLNIKSNSISKHIHFIDDIYSHAYQETITYYELSGFLGKLIQATNEQYLEHLKCTALLLKNYPNFQITLSPGRDFIYAPISSLWIYKNLWLYKTSNKDVGKIRFCDNQALSSITSSDIELFWNKTPIEYRNNTKVATALIEISQKKHIIWH